MDILSEGELIEEFFKILHGVGSVVGGEGTGLSDGIDVTHVPDGGSDLFILIFDEVIDFFIGGVGPGDEVVFVEIGVIGPRCVREGVPKPLNGWADLKSKFCMLRATAFIANNNNEASTQILIRSK